MDMTSYLLGRQSGGSGGSSVITLPNGDYDIKDLDTGLYKIEMNPEEGTFGTILCRGDSATTIGTLGLTIEVNKVVIEGMGTMWTYTFPATSSSGSTEYIGTVVGKIDKMEGEAEYYGSYAYLKESVS